MTTAQNQPQLSLSTFAITVYANEQIRELCLGLQNEHQVDVVLLLSCCWYGTRFGRLGQARFRQMDTLSAEWTSGLVHALRGSRRWLKNRAMLAPAVSADEHEQLRERIKALELAAEFMQLRALEDLLLDSVPAQAGETAITSNLELYARERKVNITGHARTQLVAASIAACPPPASA